MNWSNMTSQQQWQTVNNMKQYGGGFASAIGEAWMLADSHNTARLVEAFPHLIDKYNPVNGAYATGTKETS